MVPRSLAFELITATAPQPSDGDGVAAHAIDALVSDLLSTAGVGLAVLDRDLRYVTVNAALAAMNGLPVAQHAGRTIGDVRPELRAEIEPLLERALAGEPLSALELATEAGGESRSLRLSLVPLRLGDDPPAGVVAIVVDVGEHRDAERALRIARERLSLVLEGTGVGIFEWHAACDRLSWSPDLGLLWGRERGWRPEDLGELLATVHPDDRETLQRTMRDALRHGRPYELEFRVVWPDGPARWVHTRTFAERDEHGRPAHLVGLVSDVHARRVRELGSEFLSRAGLELARSLDATETLERVATLAVPDLAEWCAVQVVGHAGRLETIAVAHADPERAAMARDIVRRYPPDPDAPTGAVAVTRTGRSELYPVLAPEVVEAAARDDEHLRLIRELQMRSAMIVPIVARGEALGAITFIAGPGGPSYATSDLELAEELGRRVGLALDNARTHEHLAQVQAVTDVALSHLERHDLLTELLSRIRKLLRGDFAVVLLKEPHGDALRVEAAVGLSAQDTERVRVAVGRGLAGTIAAEGRPRVFGNLREIDVQSHYLRERALSAVAVPLIVEGQVLGVMHVSSARPDAFSEADLELMELVAERVVHAIAHARVYEETRVTSIALQRALLPDRLPDIDGASVAARYLPGHRTLEVGGDWYDVLRLPDGRYGLVVGDVVGRGVHAAAVMGQLRAALRAYLHSTPDPAAALAQLDALVEDLEAVSFATLIVATYDAATGALQLASAGHPPPAVREPGGGCRMLDFAVGPALGVGRPERAAHEDLLAPGGMVLAYTDGLLEVRGTDIDERLALLCRTVGDAPDEVEAAADHVLAAMLGEPGAAGDDTALLLLRRGAG